MDWEIDLMVGLRERYAHPWLDTLFAAVTHLGDPPVVFFGFTLLYAFFRLRWQRREAILTLALALGVFLAVQAIKFGLARSRPALWHWTVLAHGFSFPSGHAAYSMALYGWLGYLTRQRLLFGLIILLVGLSRMYLGVHWPSDVAAGWLLAGVAVLLAKKKAPSPARHTPGGSTSPVGRGCP